MVSLHCEESDCEWDQATRRTGLGKEEEKSFRPKRVLRAAAA